MLKKRISVYSKNISRGIFSEVLSSNVAKQGFINVGYAFDLRNVLNVDFGADNQLLCQGSSQTTNMV